MQDVQARAADLELLSITVFLDSRRRSGIMFYFVGWKNGPAYTIEVPVWCVSRSQVLLNIST